MNKNLYVSRENIITLSEKNEKSARAIRIWQEGEITFEEALKLIVYDLLIENYRQATNVRTHVNK